ncbi:helix-turn-helix domain-containing protein [Umezawaea sp. Da 62-37]|uniref:helix-turn-helix domain-containing protein n=1 Tax=Umezawaea sp. Da 62-37 TaxID=3075927 RepID=UPI0028F6F516|nr:helix-turn-helix domain-containing protein [Umezawaea sp. Da 62-37]WNV90412.1 helix-turn-helix domain-containing protein [Umezawaea sp. Da 62-37]
MEDLVGRLAALDPDAGAAVKVIAYFDRLVEARAGLEPIVRGAAVLTGVAARLVDDDRGVSVRVDDKGVVRPLGGPPDPRWPNAPLHPGGPPALWLERPGPAGPVEAMVLERAVSAARGVLARQRGPATADDVAAVLDATVGERARQRAARRLGLGAEARAVALDGNRPKVLAADREPPPGRAGVGPTVPVLDLPSSWAAAKTALRFAAAGTEQDPGPSVVHADRLGGLAVLAAAVGPGAEPVPDVRDLERARSAAPWALATLVAVATTPSLRTAATTLVVHHSTLQDRLAHVEDLLGWSVRDPSGRLRLQLAIALRRLHQHPDQT